MAKRSNVAARPNDCIVFVVSIENHQRSVVVDRERLVLYVELSFAAFAGHRQLARNYSLHVVAKSKKFTRVSDNNSTER